MTALTKTPLPLSFAPDIDLSHPSLYFNRELSEIDFFWRVLYQATDERHPLLERIRFLSIASSNLDEFVQKRVGGLRRQEAAGVETLSLDGLSPREQLHLLDQACLELQAMCSDIWANKLEPLLRQKGVRIFKMSELSDRDRDHLKSYFEEQLFPVLTPLAVDAAHPFPFISNLSLSLAVMLEGNTAPVFARLKIPNGYPRFLAFAAGKYVALEDLIAEFAYELFPGMRVLSCHPFRLTRNASFERNEEEAEDLLELIAEELRERRFAEIVRLELDAGAPDVLKRFLCEQLEISAAIVLSIPGLLALRDLIAFTELDRPDEKFSRWLPVVPKALRAPRMNSSIFERLKQADILVHHPYEEFKGSVLRFLEEAAEDPQVLAIKQTLYRTGSDSPTVKTLMRAAELGKQVVVLVEIKARFDEANNIEWARKLENAGVHVAYGIKGLKIHSKTMLVVRKEKESIKTYCHIGTGNYHSVTSYVYTDFGLLTSDQRIGQDLTLLFHSLTGYAPKQYYDYLLVAPKTMRRQFLDLIEREIEHQETRGKGRIIAKMNGLDDAQIVKKLYEASQAGVEIDLIIRGTCTLRPGLAGISDTIRVRSIVGRFLEHDRIIYFENSGEPLVFLGSADWRGRNLSDRVEVVTPIFDSEIKERLIAYLHKALADNRLAWQLDAQGNYLQCQPNGKVYNLHEGLMQEALES